MAKVIDKAPKKIISVDFYQQGNGREPVREWLKSLKKRRKANYWGRRKNGANRLAFRDAFSRQLRQGIVGSTLYAAEYHSACTFRYA